MNRAEFVSKSISDIDDLFKGWTFSIGEKRYAAKCDIDDITVYCALESDGKRLLYPMMYFYLTGKGELKPLDEDLTNEEALIQLSLQDYLNEPVTKGD